MAKPTLHDTIQTLRESFAVEQSNAQKAFDDKIASLLENVKKTFLHSLEEAQNAFEGLEKTEQARILNDADVKKFFASLGYVKRKTGAGAGTRGGGKYDEAAILAFLADGPKEQKQLTAKFAVSKQSIGAWGKTLVEAGKVKITKDGRERVWRKV